MNNSILHFNEEGINELGNYAKKFFEDPTKIDDMVEGVLKTLLTFGLDLIKETLEDLDESLRDSEFRKGTFNINRKEQTQLLCNIGNVVYERTLFFDKKGQRYHYLLDEIMELDPHTRMTEGAQASLIEESIDSSYKKGGMQVSLLDEVTKQTVKNKIHELKIPEAPVKKKEKKQVKCLYIDADEDHIARQFYEVKGDIKSHSNGRSYNTILGKMIYVYEGIKPVYEGAKRKELLSKRYFGGVYSGIKENEKLWREVSNYIEKNYDEEYLEVVYIGGDGAPWIKAGTDYIAKSIFVLDKFHLSKYIHDSTSHLLDSAGDVKREIYEAIERKDKKEIKKIYKKIEWVTESESKQGIVDAARKYILNHWNAIIIRVDHPEIVGCSAEGHISHVYSSRLSSRPMGWSEHGANQMCKLCCYKANGGKIIDLVREQKELKATGTEGRGKSPQQVLGMLTKEVKDQNSYAINKLQASIPGYKAKRQVSINTHLIKYR
jgi:hypothetical protein